MTFAEGEVKAGTSGPQTATSQLAKTAQISFGTLRVQYVEEQLLGVQPFEPAVVSAKGPEPTGIGHTDERRYAFFWVDVVDHSRIVKDHRAQDVDDTLNAFRGVVARHANGRLGRLAQWAGDGGICLFHGGGCQQRAFDAAVAVLKLLPEFNEGSNALGEPIEVRIAVHTGFFALPEEFADLHEASVNDAFQLLDRADPNSIVVTRDVHKELDGKAKELLECLDDNLDGAPLYCCSVPTDHP